MSIDINDDIVQDFLIEAGEILEQLDQQLVSLESNPGDVELLNAVFRGFHTIKGGAGFLAIEPLVEVCHIAENVFDILRRGDSSITPEMMDSFLQTLDSVHTIFDEIREGSDPAPADPELIKTLEKFANPENAEEVAAPAEVVTEEPEEEVISEAPEAVANEETESSGADEITDDEFEALLDQLHGTESTAEAPKQEEAIKETSAASETTPDGANDEITDEEFEALLDQMQGKEESPVASQPAPAVEQDTNITPIAQAKKEPAPAPKKPQPKAAESTPDKKQATGDSTVRVETNTLDRIMNMVGELVLLRNRLVNLDASIGNEEMSATVSNLDVVTADLQSSVMKTRMQPIKKIFGRFPRVVRDVARSLNKQVVLETVGEDTDLDKNLVEALTDPLIHLVRNAVDHGVETPEIREAAGKPAEGTIYLSAQQEGDHILLTIADDGAGIDADVLRRKAVEKELMDEDAAARLTDVECYNLIFLPGFSTKEQISDISGRGVGMDVVKSRINQLNGTIEINSTMGKGTTMLIKVPLTLAIMPTLMVELGNHDQIFALPLVSVNEILDFDAGKINEVNGQKVFLVRGKPLPLFHISRWLTEEMMESSGHIGHVVIVSLGTMHIGLLVDKLIGREEVVIKPLGALLQGTKGVAGATVTGDGKIALILDLPELVQNYAHIR